MFSDYWTRSKDDAFYFISHLICDYFVDSLIRTKLLIWASASSMTSFSPLEEFLIRITFHSIFSLITASLIIYSLHIKTLVNRVRGMIEHAIHTSCPSPWCVYNTDPPLHYFQRPTMSFSKIPLCNPDFQGESLYFLTSSSLSLKFFHCYMLKMSLLIIYFCP